MIARPRKAAPTRTATPADLSTKQPAEIDAMQAEVDTEEESDDGSVIVVLETRNGDASIRIPGPADWSARATDLLADGRMHSWAQLTLSDKDWDRWLELDPTNTEANAFLGRWREAVGQDEGKSRQERRSSRRMRRK